MEHNELFDALDACRPGSEDLSLPEMGDLAAALQSDEQLRQVLSRSTALDEQISRAMQQVDVPAELQQRLLQQVIVQRPSRRRLLVGLGLAAAAAVGGAVALPRLLPRSPRLVEPEELANAVLTWLDSLDPGAWQQEGAPTAEFPPMIRGRILRWVRLPEDLTRGVGVAYSLAPRRLGQTVTAITRRLGRGEHCEVPDTLPLKPGSMSGRFAEYALGARRDEDLLLLLLVKPKQSYGELVFPGQSA